MKKLLIYSRAPWSPSGFGQIANELAIELQNAGYEVGCLAIDYTGPPIEFRSLRVLPSYGGVQHSWKSLHFWIKELQIDGVIQLFDSWVISYNWMEDFPVPVLAYNPVDCFPLARFFTECTKNATVHLAMSEFAVEQIRREELMPYKYIPHSIYCDFFKPLNDKKALRSKLGMPQDAFIFGIVGTNITQRKNIPNQMLAFSNFLEKNPGINAYLYLHTKVERELATSHDLLTLIKRLKLGGRTIITDQYSYVHEALDKNTMREIYNCFDVLLNCALGEGFGIPIIEAGACGVPAIVTNFSAMPYTMGDGGIAINNGEWWLDPPSCGWQYIPSTREIEETMHLMYSDKAYLSILGGKARRNALKYDWAEWRNSWVDLIEDYIV